MSSGARVSIPNSVRKMIQNIKEITGNHSEEEIYAMLKECSMDPNETAQKLLLQDTFHEVKRKRDRRKENLSNKEPTELRWRTGMQGRGSRGGRGNYSRHILNDARGGRNSAPGKENVINQVTDKDVGLSYLPTSQETNNKEITPATSTLSVIPNGPTAVAPGSAGVLHAGNLSSGCLVNQSEGSSAVGFSKLGGPPPLPHLVDAKENPSIEFGTGHTQRQPMTSSSGSSTAGTQAPSTGDYFSASDPVLVPSHDSRLPGAMGAIKREVGSQRTPVEQISLVPSEGKSIAGQDFANLQFLRLGVPPCKKKCQTNPWGQEIINFQILHNLRLLLMVALLLLGLRLITIAGCNKFLDLKKVFGGGTSVNLDSLEVGPSKEWKPKPTNSNLAQGPGTAGSSEVPTTAEANTQSCPDLSVLDSKEATSRLQRKLEELHFSDAQHVIIPNHLHVPETEKIGFCFGSFDATFSLNPSNISGSENDRNPTPLSETSESVEETEEHSSSLSRHSTSGQIGNDFSDKDVLLNQNALETTEEGDYPDHPQSPAHGPENLSSGEGDTSSTAVPEYSESKQETALPGNHQYSMIHTSPSYSFGFMPPMVGSQLAPFESSESQARDVPRLPSFVVPQPFDAASCYAQFYRSGTDSDGRISPFHSPGVTVKYNGNVTVLSPQTSQSAQEAKKHRLIWVRDFRKVIFPVKKEVGPCRRILFLGGRSFEFEETSVGVIGKH
ncbi:hypothetical protein CsSME_00018757 [Camellia sinensis var. sinensis]